MTCVDLDEKAIALARENANANQVRPTFVHADAFGYMRQMAANGRTFGVVVLDPPKLIPGRLDIAAGKRKYFDLNVLAMNLRRAGRAAADLLVLGPAPGRGVPDPAPGRGAEGGPVGPGPRPSPGPSPDHPVGLDALEGAYLKAVWLRMGDRVGRPRLADDDSTGPSRRRGRPTRTTDSAAAGRSVGSADGPVVGWRSRVDAVRGRSSREATSCRA